MLPRLPEAAEAPRRRRPGSPWRWPRPRRSPISRESARCRSWCSRASARRPRSEKTMPRFPVALASPCRSPISGRARGAARGAPAPPRDGRGSEDGAQVPRGVGLACRFRSPASARPARVLPRLRERPSEETHAQVPRGAGLALPVPDLAGEREVPLVVLPRLPEAAEVQEDVAQVPRGGGLLLPVPGRASRRERLAEDRPRLVVAGEPPVEDRRGSAAPARAAPRRRPRRRGRSPPRALRAARRGARGGRGGPPSAAAARSAPAPRRDPARRARGRRGAPRRRGGSPSPGDRAPRRGSGWPARPARPSGSARRGPRRARRRGPWAPWPRLHACARSRQRSSAWYSSRSISGSAA